MLGHGGSSAGSYLADPTSPIPSHCAVIILFQSVAVTGALRVKGNWYNIHGFIPFQIESSAATVFHLCSTTIVLGSGQLETIFIIRP